MTRPWILRFEWSYTGPEQYCAECLAPIIDFMPDCQHITHRLYDDQGRLLREVLHRSTAMAKLVTRASI